ncbi:MAG TPA: serine/threonine-protein kinase [Polyangiaceae bacterium]|jgi:serine/threonine-protein kinase|nr:serine/threonine-protein kinase [Polyangiaceae bacterium]
MSTQDFATSETLALDGLTILDSGVTLVPTSRGVNTSLRTTVLPRVEIVGETPSVVVADGKVRYELANRLGEGGVGEVIKARDNDIERDVAIKRLRPEMRASNAHLLRFAEEVRTVGRLEHPNIVPIHDVGVHENGEYFFVMKYVEGETIENIIEKLAAGDRAYHARYPFERRVEIFMGMLEAIAYAHAKGIIHRDIKPANVMVGPYGEVMMMDWGLARTTTRGPELGGLGGGGVMGTPAYMSPEQARGDEMDERTDVYSLCVTFFELLTLHHPHEKVLTLNEMLEAVKHTPAPSVLGVPVQADQGTVPIDLGWFLEKGLRKDPAARYQTVGEMVDRLRRRAEGDIPVQCMVTFSMQASTMLRKALARHPLFVSGAFLTGTVATIGFAALGVAHMFMR